MNKDTDPMDDYGHGTKVAGIAAATIDNGRGIAGISQVNILALKVLNETGWGMGNQLESFKTPPLLL